MIYDRVSRLQNYRSLSPLMAKAIDYAMTTDLNALPIGRHDVSGDDIYIAVHEYTTKPAAAAKFEAHRKYVDLQIILRGVEAMDVVDIDGLTVREPYAEANDAAFYARPANAQRTVVSAGKFTIFLPHDVHAPTIAVGEPAAVRKVVLKIKVW